MGNKRLKDPIYGYIEIEEEIITQVIDTAVFQRLRDVIQTSYSPLYSSAVHNRFVHSIGVYYLGKIVSTAISRSLDDKSLSVFKDNSSYIKMFELACLLHDIGHAPFLYTGEQFYLDKGERTQLHTTIVDLTGDQALLKEIKDNSYKAAPHELMSAVVALRTFHNLIPDDMKSFFVRCIIGYKYTDEMSRDKSCMNCLIELLNSKIIDVDKMDYLIRDSYMTGYDTVSIDYERLLNSIRIRECGDEYRVCFDKSAVSVIENVVYAHDAERKWIQNHPIVLYEAYIIENTILEILQELKIDKITEDFLCEKGVETDQFGTVRLMSDSDIVFLMKNLHKSSLAHEYYNRKDRKHPIWKTEAEFQAIFKDQEEKLTIIEQELDGLKTHLRSLGLPFIINEEALAACEQEVTTTENLGNELAPDKLKSSVEAKKNYVQWIKIFEKFADKVGIEFEFLIIYTDQFNSGFRKQEFGDIEIIFPELKEPCKFKEVSNVLMTEKSKGEKFFFIYYNRAGNDDFSITDLVKDMLALANDISVSRRLK